MGQGRNATQSCSSLSGIVQCPCSNIDVQRGGIGWKGIGPRGLQCGMVLERPGMLLCPSLAEASSLLDVTVASSGQSWLPSLSTLIKLLSSANITSDLLIVGRGILSLTAGRPSNCFKSTLTVMVTISVSHKTALGPCQYHF